MSLTDWEEQFYELNTKSKKLSEYFIYFNLGGILISILVSFWLKIDLDKFSIELDSEINSPSDYGLKVKYVPKNWKPEFLKE